MLAISISITKTEADTPKKTLIGLSVASLNDTFMKMLSDGIVKNFKKDGIAVQIASCDLNPQTQTDQLENFVAMGCKMIICFPMSTKGMESMVKKARDKGVLFLLIGTVPTYVVDGTVNCDSVQVGQTISKMAIKWIDKTFPKASKGSIKVAALLETGEEENKKRSMAMLETIKADSRVRIVFQKEDNSGLVITKANEAMNEALGINHDINLVLCFSEAAAIGANSVIMSDKKIDKSRFAIFAGSVSPASMQLLESSKTDKSVLRGLARYGTPDMQGNIYQIAKKILNKEVKIPYHFNDPTSALNTVGFPEIVK